MLTFVALEGLKQFNERISGELLMVLGSNLHADLQVLANVGCQHGLQALERVLHRQRAKVCHQPLSNRMEVRYGVTAAGHLEMQCI